MSKVVGVSPVKKTNPPLHKPPFKSILSKKQTEEIKVIYEGEDLTPETLNPILNEGCKLGAISATISKKAALDEKASICDASLFSQSTSRFHTELHKQQRYAETVFRQSYNASFVDDVVIEPEHKLSTSEVSSDKVEELPIGEASQVCPVPSKMPSHISLLLKETNTFYILELPSKTAEKDSEEGALVEADNARYEYLTEGKGRNRKVVNAEVQTVQVLLKTRATEAVKVARKHNQAFASEWDMYDSYGIAGSSAKPLHVSESQKNVKPDDDDSNDMTKEEVEFHRLLKMLPFQQALCVTERLLANNNFNNQQKAFRGLCEPDPNRENIEYKYRLRLLWTFANDDTRGKCVTAMCWNDDNSDILAVGYGKFYYTDRATGMVMLWNIKNPVQPERCYKFDQPVTTIDFSKNNPNLLGIGFYDGTIKIIDISIKELTVIGYSGEDSPSFEPIWQIIWYKGSDYFQGAEQIITTCQDGRISFYRNQDTLELIYQQIMRINKPEGKLKGIEMLRRCHIPGIPVNRYAAALVIRQHPVDGNTYYVGTSEGTIHKCSRNYFHQHLDLFLAHYGPLYEMKFSPFCNKIFLTCGDDWHVRIWADGITEPLFELTKEMQSIQSVDWSPTHSTIIANVCGSSIYIWDIQRKVYNPQSIYQNPLNCRNTVIRFAKSGKCIVVGDIEGNVYVYALEDMPFAAYFPDDLLTNSIIRCLNTRPDLIKQLKKLGGLSFNKVDFDKNIS